MAHRDSDPTSSPTAVVDGTAIELSVIVPCLNEELNIPEVTRRLLATFGVGGINGEVVIVDDGSTDGTKALLTSLTAAHAGRIVAVHHAQTRGIAAAWRSGAAAARGKLIATIDGDLQYQPEDLLRLHRELHATNVDVVQGWRSAVGRRRDERYYLSRGLNHLLNRVFRMDLADNKSGFVMCSREVFLDLLAYEQTYFYWQSFIMVAAHAKGYSYKQVETLFEERRQGTSFLQNTAISASFKSFYDLGKAAWEYRVAPRPHDVAFEFLRRHPVVDRSPERNPLESLRWQAYLRTFDKTHWMITRDVEHYYETMRKTQWLSSSATRDLQDEKLRRMVRHAYRNVPFYRAQMRARKLSPEDIRGQADLHKLPFLTKEDVRKHLHFDIMSENHDKAQVLKITTSGSSGEPFVCYADRSQLEFRWAATLRAQEWTGYRFGEPAVRLWHQTIGMTKLQSLREQVDAVLCNRTFVPVFELADSRLAEMLETIASIRPVLIDGYAEALDLLANYIKATGQKLPFRPRGIMSSAQTLPLASRQVIEEAFGCRVFDKYGSREFSGVAYECEAHAGHHVVAENYIVEVLRDGVPAAPGEVGEVVITDLNNACMPFIRYRIGDLAEAMADAPCTCGRGAARIGAIEGRVQSIIQGLDGRYLPGTFFAHYLKEFDYAIERFQVVQERPAAITFRIVKGGRFSDDVLDEILATFRRHLGEAMAIDVEYVEDVAFVRTGKRVACVSRLPVDFQRAAPVIAPSRTSRRSVRPIAKDRSP